MTRAEAVAALQAIAATLDEAAAGAAALRLLEKVAGHEDADVLRALLVEYGARALVDERRRVAAWPAPMERRA